VNDAPARAHGAHGCPRWSITSLNARNGGQHGEVEVSPFRRIVHACSATLCAEVTVMMLVLVLAASAALGSEPRVPQDTHGVAKTTEQTVNGGRPQTVIEDARSRRLEQNQHWSDGMNTKRSPDPRQRDEYGAPKVTPPGGQGTNNAGGVPAQRLKKAPTAGAGNDKQK
jgi:hypothetical protein